MSIILASSSCTLNAQQRERFVFLRLKVTKPSSEKLRAVIVGFRHDSDPWQYEHKTVAAKTGEWTDWIDLSDWDWHSKLSRAGGIAEYPSVMLNIADPETNKPIAGCNFEVELADAPNENGTVIKFQEEGDGSTIVFLAPFPLRKNRADFETGRQMAARRAGWAKEEVGNSPVELKKFEMISDIWTQYDDFLVDQEVKTLKSMGFNVIGGLKASIRENNGVKDSRKSSLYLPDPDELQTRWKTFANQVKTKAAEEADKGEIAYYEISDEISALDLQSLDKKKLDNLFRSFLTQNKIGPSDLGKNIHEIEYPIRDLNKEALPKDLPLETRRLLYYAAKFGHWWSAKQLNLHTGLIHQTYPGVPTGTLLPSHGFLGDAWGPEHIGMSYRMLDNWELTAQNSVDQLSSEDWLGMNHMYGPNYTWTGGQTFGYLNALIRSAVAEKPVMMRTYITPSDEKYLLLKAHTALGQGVKSFNFWSYGPTMVGTENYWSDLRSQYTGIVKLNRELEKAEDLLYPAKTVSDPVAILYSVSHDIWNNNRKAVFAERRLLWHGLRHLQIQPDMLREEDLENGRLKDYKVLYIADWNISRKASRAIDLWLKDGGTLYLSAGAATRDEFNEPYQPPFSSLVWSKDAAENIIHQNSSFNERTDLPTLKPITSVSLKFDGKDVILPVVGIKSEMNPHLDITANFVDGKPAGKTLQYGQGKIYAYAFTPMIAYGKLANFQPKTLSEEWQPESRELIAEPLRAANITPVAKSNIPVVETNFLDGIKGGAIVLANYTYKPIRSLVVEVKTAKDVCSAESATGADVKVVSKTAGNLWLNLPLDWTDIVTFKYCR
ncbi:MAG: hypothetical protein R2681_07775 [Pyrinomonadaceae bacterium]